MSSSSATRRESLRTCSSCRRSSRSVPWWPAPRVVTPRQLFVAARRRRIHRRILQRGIFAAVGLWPSAGVVRIRSSCHFDQSEFSGQCVSRPVFTLYHHFARYGRRAAAIVGKHSSLHAALFPRPFLTGEIKVTACAEAASDEARVASIIRTAAGGAIVPSCGSTGCCSRGGAGLGFLHCSAAAFGARLEEGGPTRPRRQFRPVGRRLRT